MWDITRRCGLGVIRQHVSPMCLGKDGWEERTRQCVREAGRWGAVVVTTIQVHLIGFVIKNKAESFHHDIFKKSKTVTKIQSQCTRNLFFRMSPAYVRNVKKLVFFLRFRSSNLNHLEMIS